MTNLEKLLLECRDAVAEGNLATALDSVAAALPPSDRDGRNELLLHRSRLKRIEELARKAMAPPAEIESQRNHLAQSVLQFLDELASRLTRPAPSGNQKVLPAAPATPVGEAVAKDQFDAFLSHNSKDKPVVREIARTLEARGLRVWLDEQELPPGQPWIPQLEASVGQSRTIIVFLGPGDMGSWQRAEMWLALRKAFERGQPVIPVLLPGVSTTANTPEFLTLFTWVDLSTGVTANGIERLVWAITGNKPDGN